MVAYCLESWQEVIIRGHHHADIVGALERESDEVRRQGDVDAFFLRIPLCPSRRVLEQPRYYGRSL